MWMRSRLPPLKTLEGFEAAARLGSFASAAHELGLSDSAISHQIRTLETALDQELFNRIGRSVVLTDAGRDFQRTVRDILKGLREGVERLAPYRKPNSVILYCDAAFSYFWLMRRLPELRRTYPQIDLWLDSRGHSIDFETTEFDILLTLDEPDEDSGLEGERLFSLDYLPYCAPELSDQAQFLAHGSAEERPQLIHIEGRVDWHGWFAQRGVIDIPKAWLAAGPSFSDAMSGLMAASQGLGVALAPVRFAEEFIRNGTLIAAAADPWKAAAHYHMVVNYQPHDEVFVAPVVAWLRRSLKD
jgi:DNA-binding transcriptional LysR family regulator